MSRQDLGRVGQHNAHKVCATFPHATRAKLRRAIRPTPVLLRCAASLDKGRVEDLLESGPQIGIALICRSVIAPSEMEPIAGQPLKSQ